VALVKFERSASAAEIARRILFTIFLACVLPANASEPEIRVTAKLDGAAVRVDAVASLRAPLAVIWRTLTDYDHLSAFIPGMATSRVVERKGVAAIVEQTGAARFLMLSYPLNVTVASEEYPPYSIRIHALKGNLLRLDGGYEIVPGAGGVNELRWRGSIQPDSFIPALMTRPILRAVVEAQFRGMVGEILRRSESETY
jgi:hypothetical protein